MAAFCLCCYGCNGVMSTVVCFFSRSLFWVWAQNEDAKKLLRLMGVPVVEAATEAEAQCAALCKAGKVRKQSFVIK